jgi:small-conductance mechanosensitive channel/CRP-like cAMP-binding protein
MSSDAHVNPSTLIIAGAIGLAATLALLAVIGSRFVRGRLVFSAWLFLAFLLLELAAAQQFGDVPLLAAIARLVFVLSVVNVAIALLVNPWRDDRPSDRFPAIVQDVAIIALFFVIATLLMREQLLATSAVGAVVVGFALQDTLGNFFAGLAIQVEKPFRVGHWIRVGDHEGKVQEVTWRATKLLTKDGQFLILPNSYISKEPILNFSEPTVPTRIEIDVGTSYLTPPNEVRAAIRRALANAPLVMTSREPQIDLNAFGPSSLDFKVRFWIEDYGAELHARDQVRTQIWYEFRRSNVEIPWPIQIEYSREEQPLRTDAHIASAAARLASVDLFAPLSAEARLSLSRAATEQLFGDGEAIVRQGESGDSMFVILEGRVRVVLEPSGHEVASLDAGGFFGEMSMLTGEPRTATVRAASDVRLLEITAAQMRDLAQTTPGLLEHMSQVMVARRVGLAAAEASATSTGSGVQTTRSLLARFQRFLRL